MRQLIMSCLIQNYTVCPLVFKSLMIYHSLDEISWKVCRHKFCRLLFWLLGLILCRFKILIFILLNGIYLIISGLNHRWWFKCDMKSALQNRLCLLKPDISKFSHLVFSSMWISFHYCAKVAVLMDTSLCKIPWIEKKLDSLFRKISSRIYMCKLYIYKQHTSTKYLSQYNTNSNN